MTDDTPPDDLGPEEMRLGRAFTGAQAPASMRRYQSGGDPEHLARLAIGGGLTRTHALVGVLVVALVGATLGAYIGLSGHRGAAGAGPEARAQAAMAYDAATGDIVMFGGEQPVAGTPNVLSDTWLFDGTGWTEAHPAHTPPARYDAAAAYDPHSKRVLLIGGMGLQAGPAPSAGCGTANPAICRAPALPVEQLRDVWAWDGHDWTAVDSTPLQRFGPPSAAALDEQRGDVVLVTSSRQWSAPGGGSAGGSTGGGVVSGTAVAVPGVAKGVPVTPVGTAPAGCNTCSAGTGAPATPPPSKTASTPEPSCPGTYSNPPYPSGCVPTACTPGAKPAAPTCAYYPPPTYNPAPQTLTWTFDGARWTAYQTTIPMGAHLVWSPSLGHLLGIVQYVAIEGPAIACRQNSPCPPVGRTPSVWEWFGGGWQAANSQAESPLPNGYGAVGAPDDARGDIVVLDTTGRTWIGDGIKWARPQVAIAPSVRSGAAMAYDAKIGKVVLFGGLPVEIPKGIPAGPPTTAAPLPATSAPGKPAGTGSNGGAPATPGAAGGAPAPVQPDVIEAGQAQVQPGHVPATPPAALDDTWTWDGHVWARLGTAATPTASATAAPTATPSPTGTPSPTAAPTGSPAPSGPPSPSCPAVPAPAPPVTPGSTQSETTAPPATACPAGRGAPPAATPTP